MTRGDEQRLDDIREMCAAAAALVARGRPALDSDEILWLALERAVEIAGEAATQLSDAEKDRFPNLSWRELVGTRVVLAHDYHRVDHDLLWGIAVNDLPAVAHALGPLPDPAEARSPE